MSNKLDDVKVGDKFVTKAGGKIIEIRGRTRKGFKILVVLTGREINVDNDYIRNSVEPYEETDPVEQSCNDQVEGSVEEPDVLVTAEPVVDVEALVEKLIEEKIVDPPKKKRGRKPKADKKPNLKGEKKMPKTRKETKKALILDLLKQGPQTRDSLANAIIEKGLSKHNDLTKEKSYASVILHNLKKEGAPVTRIERGKYILEGAKTEDAVEDAVEEAPVGESPAETTEE